MLDFARLARRSLAAAAAMVVVGLSANANAQVVGFGGSGNSGWTPNGNTTGLPSVSGTGTSADALTLTTANNGIASSYWYNTPQSIGNFTASFSYQPTYTGTPADGVALVFQNAGTSALGGGGGSLGYSGIATSAAYEINIFSGASGGPGLAVGNSSTNAAIPGTYPVSPISLPTSGDTYNVTVGFNGSQLFSTITDTTAGTGPVTFNTPVNIPSLVGASTALVGFSGATGGFNAMQTVSNFQFTPGAFTTPVAAFKPIAVTGFNQMMVLPASASGGSSSTLLGTITASVDGGTGKTGDTFYEQGFNPAAPLSGVPVGGQTFYSQSDNNHQFMLQPTTGNDAVMLDSANTTGTLKLTGPSGYSALSFLVQDGNGLASFGVKINFANGTSETHTVASPDWFGGSPIAWLADGRWNATNNNADNVNSQNPRLYEEDLTLTDSVDPISSIDFTWEASGGTRTDIFGVSGISSVPEPASLGIVSLAGLGLLRRRRRAAGQQ